jgi:LmbE family N-acetylglucosaminyl deacetylase
MKPTIVAGLVLLAGIVSTDVSAQTIAAPKPDKRYKADILVIVAHPDDETEVTGYLARAIFDEHKRIAVIFGTRGNGGGNAEGAEQAAALGAEREIEGRRALNVLGVTNVWFLNGPDTPGQDVLRSLETWSHGTALDQTVRLVRLTRPEVIMTWLPEYVAGENHGDHQAAGVIATEAFDLAGDPTAYPEQVSAPRDANNIGNLTEGLHPWQAKKIYYFTDASHPDFQKGRGPSYSTTDDSASKHTPYYKIAAEEMTYHLTQGDTGQMAVNDIKRDDYTYFRQPVLLILGKSYVKGTVTGDVLEGIDRAAIGFHPAPGYQLEPHRGLWMELGGPWAFYHRFWQAHGLNLNGLIAGNEVSMSAGEKIYLPVVLHNDSDSATQIQVTASLPDSWTDVHGSGAYSVDAHGELSLYVTAKAPAAAGNQDGFAVSIAANAGGNALDPIRLRVYLTPGSLPQ